MNKVDRPNGALARNVRRIGHLDLPGAGQVNVAGHYAYVGHIPNKQQLGTSIVDISDPANPRAGRDSHARRSDLAQPQGARRRRHHGGQSRAQHDAGRPARRAVAGDRGASCATRSAANRRAPSSRRSSTSTEADLVAIEDGREAQPYRNGGFRIYDVADPAKPKLIHHQLTGGIGVHRFDMDERYAYISTEMEGFVGNILVIYDMRDPASPQEVSRWWMPGQHIAGGEKPTWSGKRHRLHHALRFGDEMWASCWHGGFRIVDVSDISKPKTVGVYNYHPPFPEPTHTVMPVPGKIGGKRIALAIDEEDQAQSANEEEARRGRLHAGISLFDVTDYARGEAAVAVRGERTRFAVRPHARRALRRASVPRAHDRHAGAMRCGSAAGLRIIDVADPMAPREVGYFIPEPVGGRAAPQSNDVVLDERGLIYVVDRHVGFDVLEFNGGSRRRDPAQRLPAPIERRGIGAERLARLRIEIKHVPAAIELELRAAGRVDRRQVVEHVARHAVGRDHVGIAVRDQQAERRAEGEQRAQIVFRARLQAAALPVPVAGDVVGEQRIGHLGLEAELVARVGGHGAAIGARDAVEDRIAAARRAPLGIGIVDREGRVVAADDLAVAARRLFT